MEKALAISIRLVFFIFSCFFLGTDKGHWNLYFIIFAIWIRWLAEIQMKVKGSKFKLMTTSETDKFITYGMQRTNEHEYMPYLATYISFGDCCCWYVSYSYYYYYWRNPKRDISRCSLVFFCSVCFQFVYSFFSLNFYCIW